MQFSGISTVEFDGKEFSNIDTAFADAGLTAAR
jgi:hypothetical protein